MRKLRAYVHINAPVQTVRQVADDKRQAWLVAHGGPWLRTLSESWEADAAPDGTNFTLRMEYQGRLPFVEELVADQLQDSLAVSVGRLKALAEHTTPS